MTLTLILKPVVVDFECKTVRRSNYSNDLATTRWYMTIVQRKVKMLLLGTIYPQGYWCDERHFINKGFLD
jgi:hypothetical protein